MSRDEVTVDERHRDLKLDEREASPTGDTEPAEPARRASAPPLPERYSVGDEIARGGMGRVVEATDTLLDRVVAVKQALSIDSDALRRFQRETRITARLEHPAIIPVYDAGRAADGTPYYVMRKVSGRPLDELIREADSLDQRLALLPKLLAATQAVAHAHSRGVIHRDLKPSNILAGDLGETIVIDWGLAKVLDEADTDDPLSPVLAIDPGTSLRTRAGAVVGTPGFMPVEQLEAKAVDARSDVYALGATLYYLLSQRIPHAADSEDAVMSAALAGPPAPIATVVAGVPPELSAICDKALAFRDTERYPDAGALAADLDRFLRGQLVAAHDYSRVEKLVRFVRRNRVPVIVIGAAVLALSVGGLIAVRNVIAARDAALADRRLADEQRLAAEHARERETARANEVTIARARLLLDTNPREAVELVRPLARDETMWRDVRAIVADAKGGGIARHLPAAERTESIDIAPDGVHGASAGTDGTIRVHDLRTRTGPVIAELKREVTVRWVDDAHLAVFSTREPVLEIIAIPSGKRTPVALAAKIRAFDARGGTAWWSDVQGHVWRLAPNMQLPEDVVVNEAAEHIAASPDGTHAAIGGHGHLTIVGGGVVDPIIPSPIFNVTWPEPNRVLALGKEGAVDVTLTPRKVVLDARTITALGVAAQRDIIYTAGINGLTVDAVRPAGWDAGQYTVGIMRSGDDVVVTGDASAMSVIVGKRRQQLQSPAGELMAIAASPSSHYVMSINRWQLFVWNLDELLPRWIPTLITDTMQTGAVGKHTLLVAHPSAPSAWLDLETGANTPGPVLPFGIRMSDTPSGDTVLAYPMTGGTAYLTHPHRTDRQELSEEIANAWFADDQHLIYTTPGGTIRALDATTLATTDIYKRDVPSHLLRGSIRSHEWFVAGYTDGRLWRMQWSSRRTDVHEGKARDWTNANVCVTHNGDVWIAADNRIDRWAADGSYATHATLPDHIFGMLELDQQYILAFTQRAESYLVDITRPNSVELSLALPDANLDSAFDEHLVTVQMPSGGIVVLDARINANWRMARMLATGDFPHLSSDGRFVYARVDNHIAVWRLDLPHSAAETAAWVDALADTPPPH